MNGPDLIVLKSDDSRQKASTRAIPSSPPAAAVRIPLAGSLRLLSYGDQKKSTRPVPRRRLLSLARRLCVCPRGLRLAHAALRGGGTASAPGVRDGRRAARAAQGATPRTCGASGGRGYAAAVRRGTRTAGAGEGATACGAPSTAGVPRGVSPRLDNRPPMASQGRGSAPTNDWTTCSRLGGGAAGRGTSAARGSGAESTATRTTRPVSAPSPTSHSSLTARWYGGFSSSSSCCCFC